MSQNDVPRHGEGFVSWRAITGGAAALLSSVALSPLSFAQEAESAEAASSGGRMLDSIVVTARRVEEDIQDVPISITALDSGVLEDFRVVSAEDLQALDPSFSASAASGRPNAPVYSLRGIRPAEAIYGQDPTVAVYLSDVVQSPSQGSNLGFYDLENVQILKGPQGTLFGRNTIGGAILLTPRKPGEEFAGNAMIGVGSYNLVETELGLDLPVNDKFRLRLAGRTVDGGHYQTYVTSNNLNGSKLGGESTRSFRLTGVLDVTDNIENTTLLTYDDKDTNGRGTVLQAVNPEHPRAMNVPGLFEALERAQNRDVNDIESDLNQDDDVQAWGVTNTTRIDLNDNLAVKAIGSYREVQTSTAFDLDASIEPLILGSFQKASLDHASFELQLLGSAFDDRLDWVTGLYYYQEQGTEFSPGPFFGSIIEQSGIVDNKSYSAFAQGSFALTPELTLTGGIRANTDERNLTVSQSLGGFLCLNQVDDGMGGLIRLPVDACQVDLSDEFSQPTGTVSLEYQPNSNVLFYVASRLGYRSGGFNLRGTQPVQYAPFDPEVVTDVEGGMKADWSLGEWGMRTNLSAYYQLYDDIQRTVAVATPAGSPASVVVNAAEATVLGLELQQTVQPTDNLTLQLNYSYNEPEYDAWVDPATGDDLSSTPFFFTPEHAGNMMVAYDVPLDGGAGNLNFTANAAYTGDTWINALHTNVVIAAHPAEVVPLLQQEAYWLLDLSAGWEEINGNPMDLSLYVKNATDEEYKTGGVQLYTGASGFIGASYGLPRTYGAQLRFRF